MGPLQRMSLMKMKAIMLASAVWLATTHSYAEEPTLVLPEANTDIQTGVIEEDRSFFDADDDPEIDSQTDLFLDRGYKRLELLSHGKLADKVYEELAAPDYEQRTGK